MKKYFLLAAIAFLSASCARFKVNKLASSELFKIPIGHENTSLNYPEQKGLYYEIPGRVAVVDNILVTSEPSANKIKIFKDNKLQVVIVSENAAKNTSNYNEEQKPEVKKEFNQVVNKNLNVPGALAAGNDDDFYVINYISATSQPETPSQISSGGYYKILHFDVKGNFLDIIGREGRMDLPFESILWMDTDDNNNLWVLYKYIDSLTLDQYKNGGLVNSISQKQCNETLFQNEKEEKTMVRQCEEMYPFYNGSQILLIGREDKIPDKKEISDQVYQFQRRIYKTLNLKNGKVETVFANMNDPEDYPYIPYESNLLIWKTIRADRFKIAVYDTDGDLIKFFQIELPDRRNNWRSTYATLSGNFYSLRLQNKSLSVYQWK
jgi:hypothetical protein